MKIERCGICFILQQLVSWLLRAWKKHGCCVGLVRKGSDVYALDYIEQKPLAASEILCVGLQGNAFGY